MQPHGSHLILTLEQTNKQTETHVYTRDFTVFEKKPGTFYFDNIFTGNLIMTQSSITVSMKVKIDF